METQLFFLTHQTDRGLGVKIIEAIDVAQARELAGEPPFIHYLGVIVKTGIPHIIESEQN